jgi:hypothetical protein
MPITPPPQANTPGVAIDNDQASLAKTLFFPMFGIYPARGPGGGDGRSFIGEIGIFAGNFAPGGAMAAGQLVSIQQNTAVFSPLGTISAFAAGFGGTDSRLIVVAIKTPPNAQGITNKAADFVDNMKPLLSHPATAAIDSDQPCAACRLGSTRCAAHCADRVRPVGHRLGS